MKKFVAIVAAGLVLAPLTARAAVTFEYLFDNAYGLQVSNDGTVVAGNTAGGFDAFRWTQAGGLVLLGRSATQMVGHSSGRPGMSTDGKRVASSIGSADSAFVTAGLWTLGSGWNQLAPPVPPGGGVSDEELCSVWAMSGNGETVVGLLWRPGSRAHAMSWRQGVGMTDLGSSGRASRANGASYDGSVIAGFDESPTFGYRQPCVWRDGTLMHLFDDPQAIGEAAPVSPTGEWVAGYLRNPDTDIREAALWHWNGGAYDAAQYLGSVPGTVAGGIATVRAVSADGKMAIGYNSFAGDPYETTGFIWTDSTGCMDVLFWLADKGIDVDPNFDIKSLEAMTPDGKTLIGIGQTTDGPPYINKTFRIQLDRAVLTVDPVALPHPMKIAAAPNPVRAHTTISFTLPTAGPAELAIVDVSGRVVRRLADASLAAGQHSYAWDRRDDSGNRMGSGIYFARLQAGTARAAAKLIIVD